MSRLVSVLLLLPLAACVTHISGLLPVSPTPDDTRVDSLTPTLQWEPFPERGDPHVTEVVYDLRVMAAGGLEIYSREGLAACAHTMEDTLLPGQRYTWTVRVRFRWDGRRRETQWSEVVMSSGIPHGSARVYLPLRTPDAK